MQHVVEVLANFEMVGWKPLIELYFGSSIQPMPPHLIISEFAQTNYVLQYMSENKYC